MTFADPYQSAKDYPAFLGFRAVGRDARRMNWGRPKVESRQAGPGRLAIYI